VRRPVAPSLRLLGSLCRFQSNLVNSSLTGGVMVGDSNGCEDGAGGNGDNSAQFKEINIPVPWGHLAAKVWGSKNDSPILALHGWQDNAGTFDKLIPMLSPDLYIVCLDFSGHGFSSHLPPGMMYHYWDNIIHVKLVAEYFGWNRFSILGHSLGGIVGSMVASTLPDIVEKLVMIDIVKAMSVPAKQQPSRTAKAVEGYIHVLKKLEQSPPSYAYEAARERLVKANNGSINNEAAEVLMRRGATQNEEGGYFFSRDIRHVIPSISGYTADQHAEYAKKLTCPLLLLKAKNGPLYEDKAIYDEFINIYRQHSQGFEYVEVEGTHHVHLVNPENVAQQINQFLLPSATNVPSSE